MVYLHSSRKIFSLVRGILQQTQDFYKQSVGFVLGNTGIVLNSDVRNIPYFNYCFQMLEINYENIFDNTPAKGNVSVCFVIIPSYLSSNKYFYDGAQPFGRRLNLKLCLVM